MTRSTAGSMIAVCLGLPLLGAWWAGRPLPPMLRFPPPSEVPVNYPRFSWIAAGLVLGAGGLIAWSWLRGWSGRSRRCWQRSEVGATHETNLRSSITDRRRFPWWGWLAVAWTLFWWWLAWTRQPWFASAQRYTFAPLWLGFIVAVNGLGWWRFGTCLMCRAPVEWLRLFGVSAAFWWAFEWLNRFVGNWHYLGIEGVGAFEYAVHASVCFSTVLPAVVAVRGWLAGWPQLQMRLAAGPRWGWVSRREAGVLLVAAGVAGLLLAGGRPLYFYPALWAGPPLIAAGCAGLDRRWGWMGEIATGDWRNAGSWALAALTCGFFWELWNSHSLAKWVYTVPFVQRWQIFEMPLLGYTGYLAFGLECGLAATWVLGRERIAEEPG